MGFWRQSSPSERHSWSDGKLQYRKADHSVELTELTLELCPNEFDELRELLKQKLGRSP